MDTVQVKRDWDRDGYLVISNASTLQEYERLQQQVYKMDLLELGLFAAFSNEQFKDGLAKIKSKGLIKDGEKLQRSFGVYGTAAAWERYEAAIQAINKQIRERCNPYEVYLYEYNNFECCLDMDGDTRAVEAVLRIWPKETVRSKLAGKRFRAYQSIDEISLHLNK